MMDGLSSAVKNHRTEIDRLAAELKAFKEKLGALTISELVDKSIYAEIASIYNVLTDILVITRAPSNISERLGIEEAHKFSIRKRKERKRARGQTDAKK